MTFPFVYRYTRNLRGRVDPTGRRIAQSTPRDTQEDRQSRRDRLAAVTIDGRLPDAFPHMPTPPREGWEAA